jgi:hypothetical protein
LQGDIWKHAPIQDIPPQNATSFPRVDVAIAAKTAAEKIGNTKETSAKEGF